jgi:hypothetical protein
MHFGEVSVRANNAVSQPVAAADFPAVYPE